MLAEQIDILLQDVEGSSPLRDGEITSRLDPLAGVQILTSDGRFTPVRPTSVARDAARRLPRAKTGSNPLGAAGPITLALASITLFAGCAYSYAALRRSQQQYGRVAADETPHRF